MPRIPTSQINDDWDQYDDDKDIDTHDRHGRRPAREDREWVEQRRENWRKRSRDND